MNPFSHRVTRLAALVMLAAGSAACFSSQTLIKLHPDGSGTIEQTNLVNTAMIGMASGMAKSVAGENGQAAQLPKMDDLFSEEQLKKEASQLGSGVRFVSSEKLSENGMQGARAVYAFDHVDALTMGGVSGSRSDTSGGASPPQMHFAIAQQPGGLSRLTITFPDSKNGAPSEQAAAPSPQAMPAIPPEAMAMVKTMFEGARLGVDIEVDGRILKTNAPATNGSRATLIAVDFGQLLSDPSRFQSLQTLKPGVDFQTVRKTLAGAKGVTMPVEPTVTIDFAK